MKINFTLLLIVLLLTSSISFGQKRLRYFESNYANSYGRHNVDGHGSSHKAITTEYSIPRSLWKA